MGNPRKPKDSVKWTELLQGARAGENQPPSAEWISRKEMREKFGFSEGHMSKVISDLIEGGKLERRRFKVWTGCRFYPMTYYREIK